MPDPNNPGSIDIRLLGQSELTSLASVVKEMSESMNVFQQGTEELRKAAEQQMLNTMQEAQRQSVPTSAGGVVLPSGVRSTGASTEGAEPAPESGELSEGASSGQETRKMQVDAESARQALQEQTPFQPGLLRRFTGGVGERVDRALMGMLPGDTQEFLAREQVPAGGVSEGASMSDPNEVPTGMPRGPGRGGIAPGSDARAWEHHAYDLNLLNSQMALPQYGELTSQNKLFMAAQGMAKSAAFLDRQGQGGAANALGVAAAGAGRLSSYVPFMHVAGGYAMGTQAGDSGMFGVNARPGFGVSQYERGGLPEEGGTLQDLPGIGGLLKDIGFNARQPALMRAIPTETGFGPLDTITDALGLGTPAGQAWYDDLGDRIKKRAEAVGVTNEDADFLQEMLAESGRLGRGTGTDRKRAYDQGIDFLSRDMGLRELSTEAKINMLRPVMRQEEIGNDNIEQFMETMREVPDAAKAAHIGVEEFVEQMGQVTEQLEAAGASAQNARQSVVDWSAATGTMPGTLGALMENPYVQGTIAAQSGMLPQTIGALPQGQRTQSIYRAARQIQGAYQGIGPKTQEIRGPNGEVLGETTVTARAQREALAAADLGIPLTEYRRMMRQGRRAEKVAPIQTGLQNLDAQMEGMTERQRARFMTEEGTDDTNFSATEMTRYMGEQKIGTKTQRGHLRELAEGGEWERFQKMARNMIDKETKADEIKDDKGNVQIELSDEAKRWFNLREKKDPKQTQKDRDKAKKNKGEPAEIGPSAPDYPAHPNARNWGLAGTPGTR